MAYRCRQFREIDTVRWLGFPLNRLMAFEDAISRGRVF